MKYNCRRTSRGMFTDCGPIMQISSGNKTHTMTAIVKNIVNIFTFLL